MGRLEHEWADCMSGSNMSNSSVGGLEYEWADCMTCVRVTQLSY